MLERNVPIRVLIAKPGLDGHDRGAKVVTMALKNAGMEVIYTGLHQTVDQIINAAIQEDVNVIGLSILSGAHHPIAEKLMKRIRENKMNDVMKTLTIFAAIFIPLTFIAGIYGMNFEFMPELKLRWGYPVLLLAMLAIGVSLLMYFRKKKWL